MKRIFFTATFLTTLAHADGQTCPNQQQQAPAQQAPVQQAPCPNNQQQAPVDQNPVQQPNNQQQAPVDQNPVQQPNNQQQAPCPKQEQNAPACTTTSYEQLLQKYSAATQSTYPEALMGRFGGRCFHEQTPNQPRPFLFEARGFFTQSLMTPFAMTPMPQILAARFAYDELSANVADYDTFIRQVSWTANNSDFGEPVQNAYFSGQQDTGSVMFRVPANGYTRDIHVKRVGSEIMVRYENNICSAQAL